MRRAPSDRELRRRAATASYETDAAYSAAAATGSVACLQDGRKGARVQAIYARAKDRPDRYSKVLPLIRRYAANADTFVNRSAAMKKSGRRIRFVTDHGRSTCKLLVKKVTLSRRGDDSFNNTINELVRQGYRSRNRKYLIWMDASMLCGIGTMQPDDRAAVTNVNNQSTGFARIDRTCWGGGVEAHELFHTFGAVQRSAPNSTANGHCDDEVDAMCYMDGSPGLKRMRRVCTNTHEWHIDCRHNDYFNPRPAAGSYLDRRWNTARSRFLQPMVAPPSAPSIYWPVANRLPGLLWTLKGSSTPGKGRTISRWLWEATYHEPWRLTQKHGQCRFSAGATTTTPQFWCNADFAGTVRITVSVWDNTGASNVTIKNFTLTVPAEPREVGVAVRLSPESFGVGGGPVSLQATVTDTATGRPVMGLPVTVDASSRKALTPDYLPPGRTSATGLLTYSQQIKATTRYDVRTTGTKVWKGRTETRTVAVDLPPSSISAAFFDSADTNLSTTATVAPDSEVFLRGVVTPYDDFAPQVVLQKKVAGVWTSTEFQEWVNTDGIYGFDSWAFDTSAVGVTEYRVVKPVGDTLRTETATLTLDVRQLAPDITVGSERQRLTDGSVEVTGSVSPPDAVSQLVPERRDGDGNWVPDGTIDPSYDWVTGRLTGDFTVTVQLPYGEPVGTYTFRVKVSESASYLAAEEQFTVTFTKDPAAITVVGDESTDEYGAVTQDGYTTPVGAAGVVAVQRWDGSDWVGDFSFVDPHYDWETGHLTGAFTVHFSEPWDSVSKTHEYRLVISNQELWEDTTSETFTVTFPPDP